MFDATICASAEPPQNFSRVWVRVVSPNTLTPQQQSPTAFCLNNTCVFLCLRYESSLLPVNVITSSLITNSCAGLLFAWMFTELFGAPTPQCLE